MRSAKPYAPLALCVCALVFSAARASQPGAAAVAPCDAEAYVIDQDPAGTNVRAAPGKTSKVIGNLPNETNGGIVVHISGASGGWVRIDRAVEVGGDEEIVRFKGAGWVYGPLLGVDGVGWVEGGTKLHAQPSAGSKVLARMKVDVGGAKVLGCRGKWLQVEHKGVRGWATTDTLCSNPLTNCS
ncbi:MAG TPA: SH3 domain-containing protein [Pyrinomonadaceae bacterium]|nr:SH3 domain-containing protein [Pyrinomonadaceae bacterium]